MSPRFLSKPGFLATVTVNDFIDQILTWAQDTDSASPRVITYLNAHTTNLAHRNAEFRDLLERADMRYADGMAVVKAARQLGVHLPERVNAGDFLPRFLWAANDAGLKIALLGSRQEVVESTARHFEGRVAGLKFCCVHHGHFAVDGPAGEEVVRVLRDSGANIVLVGMGSPRQEAWALGPGQDCGAKVVWCVGALFEYFSGQRRRAPVWMRRAGLEWLFRLVLEPRRLAGRYLLGNAVFLWRVHQEKRRAWR
ncbi:WecB/TagA/CpsF family glycosyltransferase [bacterium]|nr:WecB/TagA/CpsF family glycosyltransferase [bacterium]